MTSRLPVPGADDGTWGNVLNDFLSIEHNGDGSLKVRTDGSFNKVSGVSVPANPTAGQVLTATSATAASWTVPSATDASKIPLSTVTTKGDLVVGTATATVNRFAAGTNGQVLSADNTQATGLRWVSGSAQLQGVAVYVEDYGAIGDGATDDTTAIKAAINAAVTAAASGNHYAEVRFQSKVYMVSGSLTQGGSALANALLPLPMISSTAHKITLCLKGVGMAAALPLVTQTTGQKAGTVLKSAVIGTNDATYGEASIIGGPTPKQGGGYNNNSPLFNNMCIVIDGIGFSLSNNPSICAMDFRGVAEVVIRSAGIFADAAPTSIAQATATWQFGVAMPEARNNALCHIYQIGMYGMYYGIKTSEHTTIDWIATVFCVVGIGVGKFSAPHHSRINYACVELCITGIAALDYGFIDIAMLDYEPQIGGGNFNPYLLIDDGSNKLSGMMRVNWNGDPLYNHPNRINGAGLLQVTCANTGSLIGVTQPSMSPGGLSRL
jgi:hypothetical protein